MMGAPCNTLFMRCLEYLADSIITISYMYRSQKKLFFFNPFQRISVIVNPDQRICKAGICDPAAILQIRSIAVFDAERNPKYFQPIFDFLTKELELPENR